MKAAKFALLAALIGGLVGCGGEGGDQWTEQRAEVAPVSGTVLLDGEPLEGATVNFFSEAEQLTAHGRTDDQGRFQLTTYEAQDGAVPGTHKVTVKKSEVKTTPNPEDPELGPIASEEIWHTPKAYSSFGTTPLEIEVGEEGETDLTLEMES